MNHGLMGFMRAHGQMPGPGERPGLAGALAGAVAGIGSLAPLEWAGGAASLASAGDVPGWLILSAWPAVGSLAGLLYGAVFRRAASDRRGGWLFGISYGYLLWMLGPITLIQVLLERPLAVGKAAMGILAAHLIFGLVMGLLFRPVHRLVRKPFGKDLERRPNQPTPPHPLPVGFRTPTSAK